ncbi:MAG: hypothetical protein COV55_00860 [Candidatus Komeilibacteria bacterium CG11_big_fil_rev_8_21_14_0_20_36_20]|uniref:CheW-like domain-containing protein n=1 Tax=Candidatus Komeilibacteria bacterium CG11_big_fil_rev_8_21_14_0_20_36_20 TaxID=1974477 RepID=A0A2H0NDI4_9BACT|nr:MAG: hypothetical protein COV55_00860 [Candidatus Komeilibacteria bacterium CG11_big_fil_rev_8_21_14_0_20_36_20]PIR81330.1 MAG: hypothetical protein COU21_03830 [Candidatus Komeilibacteria bacterium CG10_big_fil_rev_8_21_14_0_10_36_65]PJC54960.1 MAG: hypothetical protein CO027_04500 [Candidatus Komeilibacteria bacterium CG_4_9_14_0_2_um_filter_36_13]
MAVKSEKFVLFMIEQKLWALPLLPGTQFIDGGNITPIPKVNINIVGLIYNKGRIVTVLNTFKILQKVFPKNKIKESQEDKQCLLFDFQNDTYALLATKGGETVTVKGVLTDKSQVYFKKYIKVGQNKVYILYPEEIWKIVDIYD